MGTSRESEQESNPHGMLGEVPPAQFARRFSSALVLGDDGEHEVRRIGLVVMDLVHHRLAAAYMVGNVLYIMRSGRARRHVHRRDIDADAVSGLEQVRRGKDLDRVFGDLARRHRLAK